jgi:hypothetical protein
MPVRDPYAFLFRGNYKETQGMTLRDYFASMACRSGADAVCSQLEDGKEQEALVEAERHARAAFIVADAMLKAREA